MLQRALIRPLQIGVYVRVSTKEQATEGVSLEAQQALAERHVQRWRQEKVPIGAITYYVEAGRSGKDFDRPEIKRLQADIRAGRIDLIIAYKMDRISRNTLDFRNFETLIEKHEVDLQFFNDRYETRTASDFFVNHVMIGQAEFELLQIGERTRDGLNRNATKGVWNGRPGFGYRKDESSGKLVPHPDEAEVIRKHIFDAMEVLGSVGRVLQRLHRLGVRHPKYGPDQEKVGTGRSRSNKSAESWRTRSTSATSFGARSAPRTPTPRSSPWSRPPGSGRSLTRTANGGRAPATLAVGNTH